MMRTGYDRQGGKVHPDCPKAMLYVRWHYHQRLDAMAHELMDKFCVAAYTDDISNLIWVEQVFSVDWGHPPPSHVPPVPGSERDKRLAGSWRHTSYLFSGGSSLVTTNERALSPDGRFVESKRSSFSSTFTDSLGNWAGWSDIYSKTPAGSRGRWATFRGRIVFRWDDNLIADYPYEAGHDSFLLVSNGDNNQLWKRI